MLFSRLLDLTGKVINLREEVASASGETLGICLMSLIRFLRSWQKAPLANTKSWDG